MTEEHEPTRQHFRGRALMCRRGAASRSRVVEDGGVTDKDTRPDFPTGQCVVHKVFGLGKVSGGRGVGGFRTIDVNFEKHGAKTFYVQFLNGNLRPEDAAK